MNYLSVAILAIIPIFTFSQDFTSKQNSSESILPFNQNVNLRYEKDFEFVDDSVKNNLSDYLHLVNLNRIDALRSETSNVVYLDRELNILIKIYSREDALMNGSEFNQPLNHE